MSDEFVGFYVDDKTFCRRCVSETAGPSTVTVYPTDAALGYAGQVCDSCGGPLCTPEQWADAQHWVERYG